MTAQATYSQSTDNNLGVNLLPFIEAIVVDLNNNNTNTTENQGFVSKLRAGLGLTGLSNLRLPPSKKKGVPLAYLQISFFDAGNNLVSTETVPVSSSSKNEWGTLQKNVKVAQSGSMQVVIINESDVSVWFDEIAIKQQEGLIVQENHYDAWGLDLAGLNKAGNPEHDFKYNGKELIDELDLNWNDYGARQYDSQLSRFVQLDPMSEFIRKSSPYVYALNNPIRHIDNDGMLPTDIHTDPPYVRIILYGGARAEGHNQTFKNASKLVQKDYGKDGDVKDPKSFESAHDIINTINEQGNNSIQSLDILSHGSTEAIEAGNPSFTEWFKGMGVRSLYKDAEAMTWENKTYGRIGGDPGLIEEIDFSKFTYNAKVEFHGCNTCGKPNVGEENFASAFSKRLYEAGKKNAVVIGHSSSSGPGTKPGLEDYRHGKRIVYHNGKVLFTTTQKGRITGEKIKKALIKKQQDEAAKRAAEEAKRKEAEQRR